MGDRLPLDQRGAVDRIATSILGPLILAAIIGVGVTMFRGNTILVRLDERVKTLEVTVKESMSDRYTGDDAKRDWGTQGDINTEFRKRLSRVEGHGPFEQ